MLEPRVKEKAEKKKNPQARSGYFINILSQDLAPSVASKQNMHMYNIK